MALQDSDIVAAVNGVTLNGKPLTAQSFQSLLQYAALAFMRDYATSQAAITQQQLGQQANAGQVALASLQAPAIAAPPAPAPAPSVVVNIPAAPVLVEEYYTIDFHNEIEDPSGKLAKVIEKGNPDGSDKLWRYRLQKGTGLHVKSTEARLEIRADGSKWALPTDGRPALPYGPGLAGRFGLQPPPGK